MPSGNVDKPLIEDNHDGTVSIRYDPREEGLHEMALKYNGEHVSGKFSSSFSVVTLIRLEISWKTHATFPTQVPHSSFMSTPSHLDM